jgi:hypothetical protein
MDIKKVIPKSNGKVEVVFECSLDEYESFVDWSNMVDEEDDEE